MTIQERIAQYKQEQEKFNSWVSNSNNPYLLELLACQKKQREAEIKRQEAQTLIYKAQQEIEQLEEQINLLKAYQSIRYEPVDWQQDGFYFRLIAPGGIYGVVYIEKNEKLTRKYIVKYSLRVNDGIVTEGKSKRTTSLEDAFTIAKGWTDNISQFLSGNLNVIEDYRVLANDFIQEVSHAISCKEVHLESFKPLTSQHVFEHLKGLKE